jgi:hypothetical protein
MLCNPIGGTRICSYTQILQTRKQVDSCMIKTTTQGIVLNCNQCKKLKQSYNQMELMVSIQKYCDQCKQGLP